MKHTYFRDGREVWHDKVYIEAGMYHPAYKLFTFADGIMPDHMDAIVAQLNGGQP